GGIGRDAAGKTGTTDGSMTAWFAGYTPDLAAAVSLGDPRGPSTHPLFGVTIGGAYYPQGFRATISRHIWKAPMLRALEDLEPSFFTPPDLDRFGGCSTGCAPKPPKKRERDDEGRPFPRDENGGPDGPPFGPPEGPPGGTGVDPVPLLTTPQNN